MKYKRAFEHPQEIIRMLFVAIILIFSIVIVYNLMQDMCVKNDYSVNNLYYNSVSARILYSSECYALEEKYTMDITEEDGTISTIERNQVHAGVLDLEKIKISDKLSSCINNAQYESKIKYEGKEYKESTKCEGDSGTRKMLVLIQDGEERKKGVAEIKVCVGKDKGEDAKYRC